METPFSDGVASPLPDSLWAAVTAAGPSFSAITGDKHCDVGIVGAGFMGLAAALRLAESGQSVTVLEAAEIAWGASGRNNGLIAAGLKRDPDKVLRLLGRHNGERLIEFSGSAPANLFELIEKHNIDCDVSREGWIQAAHSRFAARSIRRRMQSWRDRGADVEMIDPLEVAARLGTSYYKGAWLDRRGGSLNPLAYARGLAGAAHTAGAQIYCNSPVRDIGADGSGFRLTSPTGSLSCSKVLVCCNAYGQFTPMHAAVMPLRTAQVASRPLSATQCERILPGGEAASDTQRLLTSFRLTADRRLIMGGAGATAGNENPDLIRCLHLAAAARFPFLDELEWEYGWSGYLALTPDHLPVIHRLGEGIYAAIGCNGRGIAMATATGGLLAALISGAHERDCPVPVRRVRRFVGYRFRRPGVAAAVQLSRMLDNISRML